MQRGELLMKRTAISFSRTLLHAVRGVPSFKDKETLKTAVDGDAMWCGLADNY